MNSKQIMAGGIAIAAMAMSNMLAMLKNNIIQKRRTKHIVGNPNRWRHAKQKVEFCSQARHREAKRYQSSILEAA